MANKGLNPQEKFRLITECRQSGLSDQQWCLEHGIKPSTFYNWVSRLRKMPCFDIPQSQSRLDYFMGTKQDVVPLEVVSESPNGSNLMMSLGSPAETERNELIPTMELNLGTLSIRFSNSINPSLLEKTFELLKGLSC